MATKYYAVKIGRNPGVYTSWIDCEKQVKGVKGAIYKSFKSEEEAFQFINKKETVISEIEKDEDSLIAYIDGSFSSGNAYGCGCIFLFNGKIVQEVSERFEDEELSAMRNVAGEIKAAELAMDYAIKNSYKNLVICYDYEGIARWPLGEWTPSKKGTKDYKAYYDEVKKKINIKFIKVKAHSGNEFNEMADELAKRALE